MSCCRHHRHISVPVVADARARVGWADLPPPPPAGGGRGGCRGRRPVAGWRRVQDVADGPGTWAAHPQRVGDASFSPRDGPQGHRHQAPDAQASRQLRLNADRGPYKGACATGSARALASRVNVRGGGRSMARPRAPGAGGDAAEYAAVRGAVVVVTGASGFVGRRLCAALLAAGAAEVRALDVRAPALRDPPAVSDENNDEEEEERIAALVADPRVHYIQADLGETESEAAIDAAVCGVGMVFHLASYGMSGGEMLSRGDRIERVNVGGTRRLLERCRARGVARLVYTSTYNVVFAGQPIREGREADLPYASAAADRYGRSKAAAERLVLAAAGAGADAGGEEEASAPLVACALRPAGIYGEGEERHLPRIVAMLRRNLFLFTVGPRDALVDWVHVDNLVHAQLLAACAPAQQVRRRASAREARGARGPHVSR
eukprot:scaffold1046_cov189-Prasinococcus_capsulatus_cf.AAC.1